MKTKLPFIAMLLATMQFYAQTQIGPDIDGETADDRFGSSISLSNDGNILAIGAILNDGINGSNSGHVRVYENINSTWTQIGSDIDGETANDFFGSSVSLSSDGSVLAIGAAYNDGINGVDSGHVRVYQNINSTWTQIGSDIDGEAAGDNLGISLSLSSDGNILAIGAISNDGINGANSGHVRVYQNINSIWTQIGSDIDGEAANDLSGFKVDLSSDGSIVAIGSRGNDGNGDNSGHVRVYENINSIWTQIGSDIDGEAENNYSSGSLSLSSDGNILAIGAVFNDGVNGLNSGHVRVYENISGVWTQIGLDIDGEAEDDYSGSSVSLSNNGSIIAIGAQNNDGNGYNSGHVRIYENISGVWTQLGLDIDGEAEDDSSGSQVSLSNNGSIVIIGSSVNDGNGASSGHVRAYDLSLVLSLEDNDISENFNVYPNPVNNQFQIQLKNSLELEKATIYTYFGQLVLESEATSINVNNLSSGVYILKIKTNEGEGVKKIVIK